MQIKQRLISNTIFAFVELFFSRLIGLVLTPYVLYKIGLERFAIWGIIGSILGYLSKADMGVATSYARYIAQFYAQKDYDKVNKVINSGFIYYACFGAILWSVTFLGGDVVFSLFRVEEPLQAEVRRFLLYGVLFNVCDSSLQVFNAVLWGIQRADVIKKIRVGIFMVDAVCKVLFLGMGYRLGGIILTDGITTFLGIAANIFFAYRFVPELRFHPRLFDWRIFRQMFGYGLQLQLGRIAKMTQMHLSKLVLAHFLPLASIAVYEIGNRIALTVGALPLSVSPAIIPAAAHLNALADQSILYRLYDRGSRYMVMLVIYVSGFFVCMMPVVIAGWIGTQIDISSASTIARILISGYAYTIISDVLSVVLLGLGYPGYGAQAAAIKIVLNVGFNFLLVSRFGFLGAALATALTEVIGTVYFVSISHHRLKRSYWNVVRQIYLLPIIAGGIAYLNTFLIYRVFCEWFFVPQGRVQNLSALMIAFGVFSASYGLILLKSQYIDRFDKELLGQSFQKLKISLDTFRTKLIR